MKQLALVLIFCAFARGARASSFSCTDTSALAEKLTCTDAPSSALDSRLAALYTLAIDVLGDRASLRAKERNWISRVRDRCKDAPCIRMVYQRRINELEGEISKVADTIDEPFIGSRITVCSEDQGTDNKFSVSLAPGSAPHSVKGTIDGWTNCGGKVWGPIDFTGTLKGNVSEVIFNGSWSGDEQDEAFIVVAHAKIYWRVVEGLVHLETYVPSSEVVNAG